MTLDGFDPSAYNNEFLSVAGDNHEIVELLKKDYRVSNLLDLKKEKKNKNRTL